MNSLPFRNVQALCGISECGSPGREASEPPTEDKGKPEAAPGALGSSTLLGKSLPHSCSGGGFDKLINLSFLLPEHSCHSKLSWTPKRCLVRMQNFSVFWCGRLLCPGSRTRDAGNRSQVRACCCGQKVRALLPGTAPSGAHTKWQMKVKRSCSVVSDSATPWTVAYRAPLSMGFSRQ